MNILFKMKVFFILGVMVFTGCKSTLHKDYSFKTFEKDLGWSVLHAKLRGKQTEISKNLTSTQSPYELIVWFSAKNSSTVANCEVILENLSLITYDLGKVYLSVDNMRNKFKKKSDGSYIAHFLLEDIELTYIDYRLRIKYRTSEKCLSLHDESLIEVVFNRDYQERKITFWDTLMGI